MIGLEQLISNYIWIMCVNIVLNLKKFQCVMTIQCSRENTFNFCIIENMVWSTNKTCFFFLLTFFPLCNKGWQLCRSILGVADTRYFGKSKIIRWLITPENIHSCGCKIYWFSVREKVPLLLPSPPHPSPLTFF